MSYFRILKLNTSLISWIIKHLDFPHFLVFLKISSLSPPQHIYMGNQHITNMYPSDETEQHVLKFYNRTG